MAGIEGKKQVVNMFDQLHNMMEKQACIYNLLIKMFTNLHI